METIFNVIHPFFNQYQWHLYKRSNTLCYRNPYKTSADEFVVTLLPKTNEIEITVPLDEVLYKNTFNNYTLDSIGAYVQMHLNYYHNRLQKN